MADKTLFVKIKSIFSPAQSRANITSGEDLETSLGKISKWFSDIGSAAFKDVPSSGNAGNSEVVLGNDSRLSDDRTPTAHNQPSSTITAMTGYTKPQATSAITSTDTLNEAIGKLEKGLDGAGGGTIPPIYINKISWNASVSPSVIYYVKIYYDESKLETNPITFKVIGGTINSSNSVNWCLFTGSITKTAYKVSNINGNNFTTDEYKITGQYVTDNIDSSYRYYNLVFWHDDTNGIMFMYVGGSSVLKYKNKTIIHSLIPIDFTAVTRVTYNDITIWERT